MRRDHRCGCLKNRFRVKHESSNMRTSINAYKYGAKYNIPDSMHQKSVIHQRKSVRGRQGSNDLNL